MPSGTDPIIFISRHRVKPGRLEGLKAFLRGGIEQLNAAKPRTSAFLAYLDADEKLLTIVHVFADSEAMASHVEGATQPSDAAYEFIEPARMEILGDPSSAVLSAVRPPAGSGVDFELAPMFVGGFLRLVATDDASRDPRA